MGKLTGRVAIVTGGGRGIGRATAERFAEEGAKVVIQTRSREPGEAAVKAIKDAGGEPILEVSDIGKRDACRQIVKRAVDEFGRLDIVLHNAAVGDQNGSIGFLETGTMGSVNAVVFTVALAGDRPGALAVTVTAPV